MPKPRLDSWTERDKRTLIKMKSEGVEDRLIAERLGRSARAISTKWKMMRQEVMQTLMEPSA